MQQTLFVKRTLLNSNDLRAWAKQQGFHSILAEGDMHVTIALSKTPFDVGQFTPIARRLRNRGGQRQIKQLGEAVVLSFPSDLLLERWQEFRDGGASWDFPSYISHVTLTYQDGPVKIVPFDDELIFGPEKFSEVKEDWANDIEEDDL